MRTSGTRLWVRRLEPVTVDRYVAGALGVGAWFEAVLAGIGGWRDVVVPFATCVVAGLVAVRRRYPSMAGLTAGLTGAALAATVGPPATLTFGIAWICAMYALAVWSGPRAFAVSLLLVVAATVGAAVGTVNLSSATFFALVAAVVTLLVRRIVVDRDRRAQLAERERDVATREAIVEERARIARELHDVIAHHVSMIVVQAGAERRLLDDNSSTREVLVTIEESGRLAMTEMRRLVGILRGDARDPLAPQPGMGEVPRLVASIRETGVPVELIVEGDRRVLPMGIDLAAYRIVQEALTNVVKHSDSAAGRVLVSYGVDCLELTVASTASRPVVTDPGDGHGLIGMRERAMLYGGTFAAGVERGAFVVHVKLPIS